MGSRILHFIGLFLGLVASNAYGKTFSGTNDSGLSTNFVFRSTTAATNFTFLIPGNATSYSYLYVKKGSPASPTDFHYASKLNGQANSISLEPPQAAAANWHLHVVTPTNSAGHAFNLTVSSNHPAIRTVRAVAKPLLFTADGTVAAGKWNYFQVEIPTNPIVYKIVLSSGTRSPDLYVQRGRLPTLASYARRSTGVLNDTLNFTDAELVPGTYFIGVYSPSGTVNYKLKTERLNIVPLTFDPGLTHEGTEVYTNKSNLPGNTFFRIRTESTAVGAWRTALKVTQGEANIFMSRGSLPEVNALYRSSRKGSDGFVLAPGQFNPGEDWYIMVQSSTNSQWTLCSGAAYAMDLGELQENSPNVNTVIGPEGWRFFKTTLSLETLAWRLWRQDGTNMFSTNMIYVKKTTAPLAVNGKHELKQAGQMLVVPPYMVAGHQYFVGLPGVPGQTVRLSSRVQDIQDIEYTGTAETSVTGYGYTTYRLEVPPNQVAWQMNVITTNGNPNLYVRKNLVPNEFYNNAFSENPGKAHESISIVPPTLSDGTFYITVAGFGPHAFRLTSGPAVVTDIPYVGNITNEQTNRVGWRYYRVTDIESQLGSLGWELLVKNFAPGTRIALRRNYAPSIINYRDGSAVKTINYYDFISRGEFLHRPGHQADIWYIGVYNPSSALRNFTLVTRDIPAPLLDGDVGRVSRANVPGGRWEYFQVNVPEDVSGWDLRLSNVKGGFPKIVVCRQALPVPQVAAGLVGSNVVTTLSAAATAGSWPIGKQWVCSSDWTKRSLSAIGTNELGRVLAMGMGRPLEAGTYFVGVYNAHHQSTSFTLASRFIGAGRSIPVTNLAFNNGSTPLKSGLQPRQADYYRVTIPPNTPSWKVRLKMSSGEAMLLVSTNKVPNVESGRRMQKAGNEQYVLLPDKNSSFLKPGECFLVVIGEGSAPQPGRIGTGTSSYTLESHGALKVPSLGTLGATSMLTHGDKLEGGEVKSYQFTTAPGVVGYQLSINNRVGNPTAVVGWNWSPDPGMGKSPVPADPYGNEGGYNEILAHGVTSGRLIGGTIPGYPKYLMMKARGVGGSHPGAAYDLQIIPLHPAELKFDGGAQVVAAHAGGSWKFFKVTVPSTAGGWDVRLVNVTGSPSLIVARGTLPIPLKHGRFNQSSSHNWFLGEKWLAGRDWTDRSLSATGVSEDGRILAMGMDRPLVPGVYYVGVYASSTAAYTLKSRGIGNEFSIPIRSLSFSNGVYTSSGLVPREADYFRVTVPPGMKSWKISLTPTGSGAEANLMVLKDALPNTLASVSADPFLGSSAGRKVKKLNSEHFLLLPPSKSETLPEGDYYLAVASEGNDPLSSSRIGTGKVAYKLTSHGELLLQDLGMLTAAITNNGSVRGGETVGYRFEVPPGTVSVEARLENRVGNPVMVMRRGTLMPDPAMSITGVASDTYGVKGGEVTGTRGGASIITFPNPTNGVYYLLVKARQVNSTFPNASFTLKLSALGSTPLEFDNGQATVVNQTSGSWRYFRVDVPEDTLGWDLRLTNVVSGLPRIVVCRDALPNGLVTRPWSQPGSQSAWPTTNQWNSTIDWTRRQYSSDGTVDQNGRILAMGMGRPLEPGSYYVGVINSTGTNSLSYTLMSRGIGEGYSIPVTTVPFEGGSVTNLNLPPREAAYFRVDVPSNAPSFKMKLTGLVGDVMMVGLRDSVPSADYHDNARSLASGKTMQKSGNEHLLILPANNQPNIIPGEHYFAVVAEGAVTNNTRIGTGNSSFILTSFGSLQLGNLGQLTADNEIDFLDAVEGGESKGYEFTLAPNIYGVELRLENRVGNPILVWREGELLPSPGSAFTGIPAEDYGNEGGSSASFAAPNLLTLVSTLATPTNVTSHRVMVKARASAGTFLDASYRMRIKPMIIPELNFSPALNTNGLTNSVSGTLENGQRAFYRVVVPALTNGELGWKLELTQSSGVASVRVRKDLLPSDTPLTGTGFASPAAYIVPPVLTPGLWFIEVKAQSLTSYTLTSRAIELERPEWMMPATDDTTAPPGLSWPFFGDTGIWTNGTSIGGDQSVFLENGYQHYYAFQVPAQNVGIVRVQLEAISGNPNFYMRYSNAPTVTHNSAGAAGTIFERSMSAGSGTEYANFVPFSGKTERAFKSGTWYFAVRAAGANARYRIRLSTGNIQDITLDEPSLTGQVVAGGDWRYYRFQMPNEITTKWRITFSKQSGDCAVFIRDTIPPGAGSTLSDYRDWADDAKNHGPYPSITAAGTYTFNTPPTRLGETYYIGVRGVNDATYSLNVSAVHTEFITAEPIDFYVGQIQTVLEPFAQETYRINAPNDATRLKITGTHSSTVKLFLEQGTLPLKTSSDDWRSASGNSALNIELGAWPWLPGLSYFITASNTTDTAQSLAIASQGSGPLTAAAVQLIVTDDTAVDLPSSMLQEFSFRLQLPGAIATREMRFRLDQGAYKAYVVEASIDLINWKEVSRSTTVGEISSAEIEPDEQQMFYRLRAE